MDFKRYAHLAEDVTEETGSIVAARIYGNQSAQEIVDSTLNKCMQ